MSLAGRLGAEVGRGKAPRVRKPSSSDRKAPGPDPQTAPASKTAKPSPAAPGAAAAKPRATSRPGDEKAVMRHLELKFQVHNKLFEVLDLSAVEEISHEANAEDVAHAVRKILDGERIALTLDERERLIREIQDEVFGLGPLEPLLRDPEINDILVNGPKVVYVERQGILEPTSVRFRDDAHLARIIERIVSNVGRRIDETTPLVDARLDDGSRVNVIIPPLALDGATMSIRRFSADPLTHEDLVRFGALTPGIVKVLEGAVKARLNMLVSGGTGSGKTTMLNVLSGFIPSTERIVTIEDSAELQLKQDHVVRLETRPANVEGTGEITMQNLLVNSLRMRPDRIIVGEVRSGEALDMLQAMNTGHDGSLTTVHANTPRDALVRIETMVAMTGLDLPKMAVRQQIASAINLVTQQARLSDGSRRLTSLSEIVGMEGDVITMQEIFKFERTGIAEDGKVIGQLQATGIRPHFAEKLKLYGIELPGEIFEEGAAT